MLGLMCAGLAHANTGVSKQSVDNPIQTNISVGQGSEKNMTDNGYPKNNNSKPISKENLEKIRQEKKNAQQATYDVIDNSLPGKWKVKTKTTLLEINGKPPKAEESVVKLFEEEYCLTEEEVKQSRRKKITEKLALGEMFCQVNYKHLSNVQETFTVNCLDESKDGVFKSVVKVEGRVKSLPKSTNLYLNYSLDNWENGKSKSNAKFVTVAVSSYMGSCASLQDVTPKR